MTSKGLSAFWRKVEKTTTCWNWLGSLNTKGYGRFSDGIDQLAHRVAYKLMNGPIPAGAEIDHICFNRKCVNPAHLQAVTHTENLHRSYKYDPTVRRRVAKEGHAGLVASLGEGLTQYLSEIGKRGGQKGGKSTSERKRAAVLKSLEKARKKRWPKRKKT